MTPQEEFEQRKGFADRLHRMIMERPGCCFLFLVENQGMGVEVTMNFPSAAMAFGMMDVARLHIAEGTKLAMTAVDRSDGKEGQYPETSKEKLN